MVRLALSALPAFSLAFDLPRRTLTVIHSCDADTVHRSLLPLGYGARIVESEACAEASEINVVPNDDSAEARVLWTLLIINAAMFLIEIGAGWWAQSAGLISDAMDMFADAAVYGVAIYAVGKSVRHKLTAARLSGILQLLLGVAALAEVAHRVIMGETPASQAMIAISMLALAANAGCLYLISRHRNQGVHMKASYIFSANDVLANLGVILAGVLVTWTGTPWPDWIIGGLIGAMLLAGAFRILRLR